MKLQILSDLHNEFTLFRPPQTDADIIVLAGDIDLGTRGVEWAASSFDGRPVIYVPGICARYPRVCNPRGYTYRSGYRKANEITNSMADEGTETIKAHCEQMDSEWDKPENQNFQPDLVIEV